MRQLILEEKLAIIRLLFRLSVNEATAEFNAQNERNVTSMTVRRIKKTMMTTGNIQRKKRSDIGMIRKPFWFPRLVLRLYRKKPHTSLRQAARRFNTSVDSILKVLKSLKLMKKKEGNTVRKFSVFLLVILFYNQMFFGQTNVCFLSMAFLIVKIIGEIFSM